MEIWIIGGVVVALMIYVSTKIKKESKRAYEREIFETEEFSITKPDEFLIPVGEDSEYVFEARSRDFGTEDARDFYQCQATIKLKNDVETKENSIVEIEKTENNVPVQLFLKVLANPKTNKTYELEVSVLLEFREKYRDAINEMLSSFAVK